MFLCTPQRTDTLHMALNKNTNCSLKRVHYRLEICEKSIEISVRNRLTFACLSGTTFASILAPKWDQNFLKIILKPACAPEALRRSPKILPRCLQKPQRGSKKARKTLQRASRSSEFGSPKVPRRLFSIAMYNSPFAVCPSQTPQLSLRSFEKIFSTPTFSTYSSKFGVHRSTFLSEMQLPTFRNSQCTFRC